MSTNTEKMPITRFQVIALIAVTCLNMQDGFDILAIAYAANTIANDWGIDRTELGQVLSASLFGMMLGAMLLSPFADRIGRCRITVIGLFTSGVGMLITMSADNINNLLLGRVITGIGIGGILASVNTLVSEYAGKHYRSLAIAIFQLGYPMGAFLAGFVAAWLLDIGHWRHIFGFGAVLSFAFIPIVLLLPESMSFLANSGKPDALERINEIRARLGQSALTALPEQAAETTKPNMLAGVLQLFNRRYITRTLLIWTAFFLLLMTLYFLLSWTPKLLVDMGLNEEVGNRGGRIINFIGMFGIICIGIAGMFIRPALAASLFLLALSITLFGVSNVLANGWAIAGIGVIGFFVHGSMIGLYSTVPSLYPSTIRATGTGWAIGLSRFGAVLGPLLAGILLDAGWSTASLYQVFAIPALLAAVTVFVLWMVSKQNSDP